MKIGKFDAQKQASFFFFFLHANNSEHVIACIQMKKPFIRHEVTGRRRKA